MRHQNFVMDGIPAHNMQKTTCPLKVALVDGWGVMSTHMCNIIIPGLPTTLIGHIVPELAIASLFGIMCSQRRDVRLNLTSKNASLSTIEKLF